MTFHKASQRWITVENQALESRHVTSMNFILESQEEFIINSPIDPHKAKFTVTFLVE